MSLSDAGNYASPHFEMVSGLVKTDGKLDPFRLREKETAALIHRDSLDLLGL